MGDAAAYLRDTLREREAELTRTIQLVADLTDKVAWLQSREDWWRGEWDTAQREIARVEAKLAERDAQIREWETGALAASTEIVKLRQQLRETRESFDAVVRAAGPFMPPVPEKTDA